MTNYPDFCFVTSRKELIGKGRICEDQEVGKISSLLLAQHYVLEKEISLLQDYIKTSTQMNMRWYHSGLFKNCMYLKEVINGNDV